MGKQDGLPQPLSSAAALKLPFARKAAPGSSPQPFWLPLQDLTMSHNSIAASYQKGAWIAVGSVDTGTPQQEVEQVSLDQSLLNHLVQFQVKSGLSSPSEAARQVLLSYFEATAGVEGTSASSGPLHALIAQIQADQQQLFRTVATLQQTLTVLMLQMQPSVPASPQKGPPRTYTAKATPEASLKPAVYEKGLSGTDLATRLGTSSATLSKRRSRPDFPAWSQMQDPEHLAWQYFGSTRRFHPVTLAFSANGGC